MRLNLKKLRRRIVFRWRFASIICGLIIVFAAAPKQITAQRYFKTVVVSEPAMEQVVRRILTYSFKPRNKPAVVYLSETGIKQTWLPKIKNIEFRLLKDQDLQSFPSKDKPEEDRKFYFFTGASLPQETENTEDEANVYEIGLAFGYSCQAVTNNWKFRIAKQKVKLWQVGSGGLGCGG